MVRSTCVHASRAPIVYNLDQICYCQLEDNGKIMLHFSNGDAKDLEGEEAREFASQLGPAAGTPLSPPQAA